jgi:iron complex transport system ATP-binding protein
MSAPLAAEQVSLAIRNKWLLRDVSLAIEPGEVVALVGPNGAGKSSLLRALAGDVTPTSGRVLLDGRPVDDYHPRDLALKRAVLPQQTVLQFAFSVREVVEMGRGPRRLDDAAGSIVVESLRRTDTLHLAERIYPSLSGGEQARVTLSRVLAQETPILLLDEPTASLDLHHQQMVMEVARELAAGGASVLAILHDLNLAAGYADRIGVMREGWLAKIGTPWETFTEELLSEVFACPIAVAPHPSRDCPLVIPVGRVDVASELKTTAR